MIFRAAGASMSPAPTPFRSPGGSLRGLAFSLRLGPGALRRARRFALARAVAPACPRLGWSGDARRARRGVRRSKPEKTRTSSTDPPRAGAGAGARARFIRFAVCDGVRVTLSARLLEAVDALPLLPGMRVLEIGCGPGAAAREVARRIGPTGRIVAVDRSARAIAQGAAAAAADVEAGRLAPGVLEFRCVGAEDFTLAPDEAPFDLAFALRVGALDGRYPALGEQVLARLRDALAPEAPLFVDGGAPLREIARD